jgi:hypothetical protein
MAWSCPFWSVGCPLVFHNRESIAYASKSSKPHMKTSIMANFSLVKLPFLPLTKTKIVVTSLAALEFQNYSHLIHTATQAHPLHCVLPSSSLLESWSGSLSRRHTQASAPPSTSQPEASASPSTFQPRRIADSVFVTSSNRVQAVH